MEERREVEGGNGVTNASHREEHERAAAMVTAWATSQAAMAEDGWTRDADVRAQSASCRVQKVEATAWQEQAITAMA